MNWQTFLGIAATVSLFMPAAVILYNKLYQHKSLAALLISFVMTGIFNLMSNQLIPAPQPFVRNFGIINNYLDVPLTLMSLLFFCPIKKRQRPVHLMLISFLIYEVIIAFNYGMQRTAIVYIMGPGIAVVLIYSFYLFAKQIKITIQHSKNGGRTLMLVSILFSYLCYSIVYYFYYLTGNTNNSDVFLLYYLVTMVSALIMTAGLHLVRKRLKELQEVKNTRKELAVFFNS